MLIIINDAIMYVWSLFPGGGREVVKQRNVAGRASAAVINFENFPQSPPPSSLDIIVTHATGTYFCAFLCAYLCVIILLVCVCVCVSILNISGFGLTVTCKYNSPLGI